MGCLYREQRPDPRREFLVVKRLCHIIISTDVKTFDFMFDFTFCRKHENRDIPRFFIRLESLTDFIAVYFRHHNVKDDQIGIILRNLLERLFAVVSLCRVVSFSPESLFQQFHSIFSVIDNQNLTRVLHLRCSPACPG